MKNVKYFGIVATMLSTMASANPVCDTALQSAETKFAAKAYGETLIEITKVKSTCSAEAAHAAMYSKARAYIRLSDLSRVNSLTVSQPRAFCNLEMYSDYTTDFEAVVKLGAKSKVYGAMVDADRTVVLDKVALLKDKIQALNGEFSTASKTTCMRDAADYLTNNFDRTRNATDLTAESVHGTVADIVNKAIQSAVATADGNVYLDTYISNKKGELNALKTNDFKVADLCTGSSIASRMPDSCEQALLTLIDSVVDSMMVQITKK